VFKTLEYFIFQPEYCVLPSGGVICESVWRGGVCLEGEESVWKGRSLFGRGGVWKGKSLEGEESVWNRRSHLFLAFRGLLPSLIASDG